MTEPVTSPCNNICRIHAGTGWCEGCARDIDEIMAWGSADEATRRIILHRLPPRREQLAELGIFIADKAVQP
jgi:predicted Fe-S protein YdhL (DUF1289 family)